MIKILEFLSEPSGLKNIQNGENRSKIFKHSKNGIS